MRITPITVWVVSKNESNCLLENKMVFKIPPGGWKGEYSPLIWRNVRLLHVVQSSILWLTI